MANAQSPIEENPLLKPFEGPHESVQFSKIKTEHWMPAIDRGLELARADIDAIVNNPEAPTFENTIVAYETSGQELNRVLNVFYPLMSANSDAEMMALNLEASKKLSEYSTDIILNEGLWNRIRTVYDNRDQLNLDPEDMMLLVQDYEGFAQNGATLQGKDRDEFRRISAELSRLTTLFGQNIQKELPTYQVWLTADDLSGLPESLVSAAATGAAAEGREGEYLFTLDYPMYGPFMKYSDRRDLREKMYRLYGGRNRQGEYSNLENIKGIAQLRLELANLLGSKTFAEHKLKRTMAQNTEGVYNLLDRLADAYMPAAKQELAEVQAFANQYEGKDFDLKTWDYSYYANKLKNAKFNYDEEEFRPYFEVNNTIDGVFGLATKLYGLNFAYRPDIEPYHPDVKAFEVTDENGEYIGLIYTDFFPRASKRPGAWMTGFKDQSHLPGKANERPHVSIVMNFTKPTADKPSLLTPSEVRTFLHEFGHALHGLLADTKYASLSGTAVYRDFVELPSQFNENYLVEREFLDGFARHYETGEAIPQELIDKLIASSRFGAAYSCIGQLTYGYMDMAFHTVTEPIDDVAAFERASVDKVRMFPAVEGIGSAPTFSHIFSGGYAAGYYSYKWAEVLDADAFSVFKKNGIFDRATADSFRKNILSQGATQNPAVLYRNFRGQEPTIDALLERDGITAPEQPMQELPKLKDN